MGVDFTKMKTFKSCPWQPTWVLTSARWWRHHEPYLEGPFYSLSPSLQRTMIWIQCLQIVTTHYTCKERYHKPLDSCLGWEGSKKEKKCGRQTEEKIPEKQRTSPEEWDKSRDLEWERERICIHLSPLRKPPQSLEEIYKSHCPPF